MRDWDPAYIYVVCPECTYEVTFKIEEFPNHIITEIKAKQQSTRTAEYWSR